MYVTAANFPFLVWLFHFALLFGVFQKTEALEVKVEVPHFPELGTDVRLTCLYSLQKGDTLYSLKWYKGEKQFYQFIPANEHPKTKFNVSGVTVNIANSAEGHVTLSKVQLEASGTYRCEVITEAPTFKTKFGEGNMTVIDLPESVPILVGVKTSYKIGEPVQVNCTSPLSKPAATLEWHVNEKIIPPNSSLLQFHPKEVSSEGLETSTLGLSLTAATAYFNQGEMRLKCIAKIGSRYYQTSVSSEMESGFYERTTQVEESRLHPHSVRELTSSSSRVFFSVTLHSCVCCVFYSLVSLSLFI